MTLTYYKMQPSSIAALLYVVKSTDRLLPQPCIYISAEKGVVYGHKDVPLHRSDLPEEVQESIRKYFEHVFSLEHENWTVPGPSPRAAYCDTAQPWEIRVENSDA